MQALVIWLFGQKHKIARTKPAQAGYLVIWVLAKEPKWSEPSRPRMVIWLFGYLAKILKPAGPGWFFGSLVYWPRNQKNQTRPGMVLWLYGQKQDGPVWFFGYLAKKPEWPEPSRPGMVIWFFVLWPKNQKCPEPH